MEEPVDLIYSETDGWYEVAPERDYRSRYEWWAIFCFGIGFGCIMSIIWTMNSTGKISAIVGVGALLTGLLVYLYSLDHD